MDLSDRESQNSRPEGEKGFGSLEEVIVRKEVLYVEESRLKSPGPWQWVSPLGDQVLILMPVFTLEESLGLRLRSLCRGRGYLHDSWVPGSWASHSLMVGKVKLGSNSSIAWEWGKKKNPGLIKSRRDRIVWQVNVAPNSKPSSVDFLLAWVSFCPSMSWLWNACSGLLQKLLSKGRV